MYNDCDCSNNYGLGITQVALCPQIQMGSVQDFTGMFNVREFIPRVEASYTKDSYIWYHGSFYQCLESYTGTSWDPTKWKETNLLELVGTGGGGGGGGADVEKLKKFIGSVSVFTPGKTYTYGSFIVDSDGYLRFCVVDTASPTYVPSEWTDKIDILTILTALANDKQDATAMTLQTSAKTIVDAINEVWNVAVRKKTLVYDNYIDMCATTGMGLNNSAQWTAKTDLQVPDEVLIKNINVSDAWVSEAHDRFVIYPYTTDAAVETALANHNLRIGYWTLSKLETKVRISNASRTNDGLMSKEDFIKLEGIPADIHAQVTGETARAQVIEAVLTGQTAALQTGLTNAQTGITDLDARVGGTIILGTGHTGDTRLVDNNTYIWDKVGKLDISDLDNPTGGTYMVIFESGTPATELTVPSNIIWNSGTVDIQPRMKYCLGMFKGLGFLSEFNLDPTQA